MRRLALLAALVLAACSSVTPTPTLGPSPTPSVVPTQPSASATPAPTSTPGDELETPLPADVVEQLENVLAGYAADDSLVSISAAVLVPDVGYWQGAAGLADRATDLSATSDTAYPIGGITETFVAALILRLAEEGFLNLEDPAANHLGPLAGEKSNGATIRDLLTQRSGIASYFLNVEDNRAWTVEELLNEVGPPTSAAGSYTEYSPTNFLLLGLAIEVMTGGPLGELLHEYLLDRFDLLRTYYTLAETVDEPIAHGYERLGSEWRDIYDGSGHVPSINETTIIRGQGAMASTAPDLARWMTSLCGGQILRGGSQAQLFDFDAFEGQAMGVVRFNVPSVGQVIGHSGGSHGHAAEAYCDEDTGVVVVVLSAGEFPEVIQLLDRFFAAASNALD